MTQLRHENLTYELRGLIFEVRRTLRTGWSEEIYHQGLLQALKKNGIPVASKPRKSLTHRGVDIHHFEADLIVCDRVILELKVLPLTDFAARHHAQLIHYLKFWEKDLGFLVNFGPPQAQIKRMIWDEPNFQVEEVYDLIKPCIRQNDRTCLRQIRQHILALSSEYGLGYPASLYRSLIEVELKHHGLDCQRETKVPVKLNNTTLAKYNSDHLLVEGNYLLNINSMLEYPSTYEFARTKTYLNHLDLKFGLVVNFGKKQLQIFGVGLF